MLLKTGTGMICSGPLSSQFHSLLTPVRHISNSAVLQSRKPDVQRITASTSWISKKHLDLENKHNCRNLQNYSTEEFNNPNSRNTAKDQHNLNNYDTREKTESERKNYAQSTSKNDPNSNRAWQLHSYGSSHDLQFTDSLKMPVVNTPTQVLIKVHAASVNPIDILMTNGYGSASINCVRALDSLSKHWTTFGDFTRLPNLTNNYIEFPLTLGRDFAGVVKQVGHLVTDLKVGDEVFGVVGIQDSGTHADYIVTSSSLVRKKPKALSFVEASSIPYAGLTAWSAIQITGSYYFTGLSKRKFLVLGGSGGVGTFAVQYLKTYGAYVVSTCSPDAVPLLTGLGCDFVIDYKSEDFEYHLKSQAPFDCILDLTGPARQSDNLSNLLKPMKGQKITLSPPLMKNLDKYGLIGGLIKSGNDIIWENWKSFTNEKVCTKWGFFIPSGQALEEFADCLQQGKIQPVVEEVFDFDSLPDAYERVKEGHARGKIVIDFE